MRTTYRVGDGSVADGGGRPDEGGDGGGLGDLSTRAAGETGVAVVDDSRCIVAYVDVPVALYLESVRHLSEVLNEALVLRSGQASGSGAVAAELAE